MPSLDDLGQDEFELLARISHRYFVDGLTQEALAPEFGLSRQKVQRMLDRARAVGVVDIRVAMPPWLHLDLERAVRDAFGLTEVIVAPARQDPDGQRAAVAHAAAVYLERRLADGQVIAVSHGRDTGEIPQFFRPRQRIAATFVSAMGGSPLADAPTNPNEIVRRLADRSGGQAVGLYAPAYVESRSMREQLLREPAIADTLALASRASLALVGIGGTDDACTMVRSGCVSVEEIRRLREAGAVGDVLGHYVDVTGTGVESAGTGRLVSLSLDALHAIDTVLAVVSEAEKPRALLGVLRTGVVDVLVVDEPNARSLLRETRDSQ
ncbi:MAG TPA: sugar-binding transcriptional regulator, partial [Candidatus Limnocylindrales bacterium]|nr:sugar-binding transcriptional regulator [Candidatus Limnocylindrales bacterium]